MLRISLGGQPIVVHPRGGRWLPIPRYYCVMRYIVGLMLVGLLFLASCKFAGQWRDKQVAESHSLAQGDRIIPPVSPPAKAEDLADGLPVDKGWPVLEYNASGGTVNAKLLSTSTAEQTTEWVDSRLHAMGYDSGDNLSRLLDGVTYSGKGKYAQIYVKVGMNSSEQVTVELKGSA